MSDQERIAQLEADLAEQKFLVKRARADRDELKRIHLEEVTVREKATEHVWAMNTRLRDAIAEISRTAAEVLQLPAAPRRDGDPEPTDQRRRLEHARKAIKAGWLRDVNPDLLDHALWVAIEALVGPDLLTTQLRAKPCADPTVGVKVSALLGEELTPELQDHVTRCLACQLERVAFARFDAMFGKPPTAPEVDSA